MKYLILQNPGHNRVYYSQADKLALAELKIACSRLSVPCSDIEIIEIADIRYLSFNTNEELIEKDLAILSRLSFIFAIFSEEIMNDKTCLIPHKRIKYEYLDNKISSILKYPGKTNELFTKMMVNVALLSSDFSYSDNIRLLDPVSGKGTTLYEGTVYGFDVFGIEIESKFVHEANVYFKKYLENERIKHSYSKSRVSGTNKSNAIHLHEYEYALSKDDFKAGESLKKLGLVAGVSQDASEYFPKNYFNLIVGDLPYGIFHGNAPKRKKASSSRNPSELLKSCLSDYYKVLKKGGVLALAWNSHLVSRRELSEKFNAAGFNTLRQSPYDEFEHRVDNSIRRDIIVARKG